MDSKTFIFIGRSGCGKGTQAEIVQRTLSERNGADRIFYLETGAAFREFIGRGTYAANQAKRIMEQGTRQPDFLAIWVWSHIFLEKISGSEHIIIDGTPRSLPEAEIFDTALRFFERKERYIIYINVSRAWSLERLRARGRSDDLTDAGITARMEWFEKDVMPAVNYYRNNPEYHFIEVNGEQSIEAVAHDIAAAVFNG
ncbi:MAG: nucleoside monophosphate kinase [Candidatus Vogelbacteria bacterium]|nr:nucleoside monophosphate kinase [Candidatus Vogelbacteria bacterium]